MSNPNISRWGFNLFWYKLWYSDKNYTPKLHQDKLFTKLVYVYLMYGILYPNNIFNHKYWYLNKFRNISDYRNNHNTKYYRIMNFKSSAMNINSSYAVRINMKNIYTTKIWLFRYQNWLVINFYCFQPPKKKLLKKKPNSVVFKDSDFYLTHSSTHVSHLRRLKYSILYYGLSKTPTKKSYYIF